MWRERMVTAADAVFHVHELGDEDADLVLLLHGWPQSHHAWRLVAPLLVEQGFRVAAPDLKGFGRSVGPASYDPETLADEISQLIRALGVRQAVVVGHDFGGAVALATAFRHQGLVRGLVLVASPYRRLDLRRSLSLPVLNVPILPEVAFAVAAEPIVRAALAISVARRTAYGDPDVRAYADAIAAQPRAWLGYFRGLSRATVRDVVVGEFRRRVPGLTEPLSPPRLRVSTSVVWGARDGVTPLALGEEVARDLAATLVVADRAGHLVPEEAPHRIVEAVMDVLPLEVRVDAR